MKKKIEINSFRVSRHNVSNKLDVVILFLAAIYVTANSLLEFNLHPSPSSLFFAKKNGEYRRSL